MTNNIHRCIFPSSVAVCGVESQQGAGLLAVLVSGGFKGKIYSVGRDCGEKAGYPVYPDLGGIGKPVDLCVMALPPESIPAALECRAHLDMGGILIPSREGIRPKLLEEIISQARPAGIRIIGPRSWGVVSPHVNLNVGLGHHLPPAGGLAVVSQSAAICAGILDLSQKRQIGLSMLIDLGDTADVDCADLLDYMANHSRVTAILLHVQCLPDMRKFMSSARAASRIKPVVVLKTGRSSADEHVALTPGGSLIGEDAALDAAFRRAGIIRVETVEDLFDCGELASKQVRPRGPNIAIISNARAPGVMAVDCLAKQNFTPARLHPETAAAIDRIIPGAGFGKNPIEIPPEAAPKVYRQIMEICLSADEIDGILIVLVPPLLSDPPEVARSIAACATIRKIPVFAVWIGGEDESHGRKNLEAARIPTFDAPERAVRAFLVLHAYDHNLRMLQEIPPRTSGQSEGNRGRIEEIVGPAIRKEPVLLTAHQSIDLLKAQGFPTLPEAPTQPSANHAGIALRMASRFIPSFGPVILFGSGGGPAEISTDQALGLPPLNRLLARRILEETRVFALFRRRPGGDEIISRLEALLVNFSHLLTDFPEICELEISLLVVPGDGVWTINALAVVHATDTASPMHLIISPYPDEFERTAVTKTGIELFIRPIKPEDAPLLQQLWATLSPRTIYYRFSSPIRKLTPDLLVRFTQIDYDREVALVAIENPGPAERMLGVARLMWAPGSHQAEFAIVVGDPWQGKGVGARLLGHLAAIGIRRKLTCLWGLVLRENTGMLELGRKLGWIVIPDRDDQTQVMLRLDLTRAHAPEILEAIFGAE